MKIGYFLLLCMSIFCFGFVETKALEDDASNVEEEYFYNIEELEKGVHLNEEIFIINDGFKYQMNNIIIGNDCFLVCGEYQSELSYQTRFFDTFPYLAFYQNNTLKWKIKTDFYGHGRFISGVILEDRIIVAGTFENKIQIKQIGIFEISFNGDILNYYISNGNNNSDCENVYAFCGNYYITGETEATDLGYGKVENVRHILVMAFNEKLNNFNNLYLSNDQSSKLYQTVCSDDKIFLFGQITGDGYFENNRSNNLIFVVSERLDLDMCKQVTEDQTAKLLAINDEIILFEYDADPSKIKAVIYGYGLNEQKEQYLNLSFNVYKIESFTTYYSTLENKVLIGCTISNNNKYYDLLTLLDDNLNILYSVEVDKKDNSLLTNCSIIGGELFSFGTFNDDIYGRRVMNVEVSNNECYFNGIKGEKIVKQVTENIFGIYDQEISYRYKNFLIKTFDKYSIKPKCSIKDKGVYQKGFSLEFNGIGYLNGEKIESGYQITENNNYLLEVKGKDQSVYYSFVVKDLSIEEKYIQNQVLEIKEVIDKTDLEDKKEDYYLNIDSGKKNNSFYVVAIFIGIGLISGLLIPIERISRRNG